MRKPHAIVLLALTVAILAAAAAQAFQPVLLGKSLSFRGGKLYRYEIPYSIRLHTNQYLNRAAWGSTSGNTQFTFRTMLRRGKPDSGTASYTLFNAYLASNIYLNIRIYQDRLSLYFNNGGTTAALADTVHLLRDSGWYDVEVIYDSPNATQADRLRFYINGVRQSLNGTPTYPSLSYGSTVSYAGSVPYVGSFDASTHYFDGYLADTILVTGAAIEPSSFGEFKGNLWVPKSYAGPYGVGGFHLKYDQAGTLGHDSAGIGNFAPGNSPVQTKDTPTNRFAILDSLRPATSSVADAGTRFAGTNTDHGTRALDLPIPTTGKWQIEIKPLLDLYTPPYDLVGVINDSHRCLSSLTTAGAWAYYSRLGTFFNNGTSETYGATWGQNNIIGVVFDADTGQLEFFKNGVSQGVAATLPTGVPYWFAFGMVADSKRDNLTINNGSVAFSYPVSDAQPLCTSLMPEPAIQDCERAFIAIPRTGNGGSFSHSNLLMAPRMAWLKRRDLAGHPFIFDAERGVGRYLMTTSVNEDGTGYPSEGVTSFNPDGVSIVNGAGLELGVNGSTYIDWLFSMLPQHGAQAIKFTRATAGVETVNHNLGAAPELIILKRIAGGTQDWFVGCEFIAAALPWDYHLKLNTNDAKIATAGWNNTPPTASVFTNARGAAGDVFMSYLFRSTPNLVKVGYWDSIANADGPFNYCGFRPAFLLYKAASATGRWYMVDSKRNSENPTTRTLMADDSAAEASGTYFIDFVSNGFKIRWAQTAGNRFIYLAIAEQPLKYANAR
jgi:hypothetical protein